MYDYCGKKIQQKSYENLPELTFIVNKYCEELKKIPIK